MVTRLQEGRIIAELLRRDKVAEAVNLALRPSYRKVQLVMTPRGKLRK